MKITFDGYIPEDDYACVTIEAGDTATAIMFTNEERDAVVDAPLGWLCPKCNRGLAPHIAVCSCVPITTSDDVLSGYSKKREFDELLGPAWISRRGVPPYTCTSIHLVGETCSDCGTPPPEADDA